MASTALSTTISTIGSITAATLIFQTLKLITVYMRPSRLSRYVHKSSSGQEPWALVTGASDGIGLAFARELAAAGLNVVLHGRNAAKLARVRDALKTEFPRRSFRILIADASAVPCALPHAHAQLSSQSQGPEYSASDPSSSSSSSESKPVEFSKIKKSLEELHLTVLINNVGGGPRDPRFVPLWEMPESHLVANVSMNALFPFRLTSALLPLLKRSTSSSSSSGAAAALVMNISTLVDTGAPFLGTYSTSKAFVMAFTRAVRLELAIEKAVEEEEEEEEEEEKRKTKKRGEREGGGGANTRTKRDGGAGNVEVLGVRVGRVTDADQLTAPPSLFMPNARTLARAALARAGYGYGTVVAHWAHALLYYSNACLVAVTPSWLGEGVLMNAMRRERDADARESKKVL